MTRALLLLLAIAACTRADSDPKPPPQPAAPAVPVPYGRWTSPTHCLQLLENGDFEFDDMDTEQHGKTMIFGTATRVPNDDYHYDLAVDRIRQASWISRCRKIVKGGAWLDAYTTAGVDWKPATHQKVRIATSDDGNQLDVCIATECLTLKKDEPIVTGEWEVADPRSKARAADEPTNLGIGNIANEQISVAGQTPEGPHPTQYGTGAIAVLGHDRFRWTVTIGAYGNAEAKAVLGFPLEAGKPVVFDLHRLAHQRLEACIAKRCAVLERAFER